MANDYTNVSFRVKQLVNYALDKGLITEYDVYYSVNSLIGILGVPEYVEPMGDVPAAPLEEILGALCDYAAESGLLENNSVVYRDLFDTKLMGAITPRPSEVIGKFTSLMCVSPEAATDYFYDLCRASDYIRTYRVAKDLKWTYEGKYGTLDGTVNLSKPE